MKPGGKRAGRSQIEFSDRLQGSVLHCTVATTMTSADFCPIIPCVTAQDAARKPGRPVGQISPDKSMNCHYTTPAFTVAPELRASLCCANSPRASALYAVSVRGLIASESRYARLPALGLASLREQATASVILFAGTPLPSASTFAYEHNC